jgi:hypothetical protein
MAFVKEEFIDKYEVVGVHKHIQCRHATVIKEDGVELSRSFHRHVIAPDDDVSNEPKEVQDLVKLFHTPEVIAAYQASQVETI